MKSEDMRRLEKELQGDLIDAPEAVFNRVRDLVREFLMEQATQVTGKRVRRTQDIKDLLNEYAYIALLQRLVEHPERFSVKDLKDLFQETAAGADVDKGQTNILAFIGGAKGAEAIERAAVEAAKVEIRKQLPRGAQA